MTQRKTSRRQFVQFAGGLALALRHGLLPAQTETETTTPKPRAMAALEDAALRIEWDANLYTRVSRTVGNRRIPMTLWGPSDYLQSEPARHIAAFAIRHQAQAEIDDANGPGTRLTLSGTSADGVEKIVEATLYRRHPGIALIRVSYRNAAAQILSFRSWTNGDFRLPASGARAPQFWCYSGATYEDRRDWVQAVEPGFAQDNFLGMEASDYGGGTPIVDVWRRDGGLAVGHVESTPRRVSLPVQAERRTVRVAVCGREKRDLRPGDLFHTPQTFVAVHDGDYFSLLSAYRRLMSERGLTPAVPPQASYEPIWCAWGYERACTTTLIEGTLPKVKDLGLEWAVIDDGWQAMIGDWNPHRAKYPNGEADLRHLVSDIRAGGLKPRLWYSPLSVAPGSDFLHDHADMLLLDKDGAVQNISWWNSFYLCPAYQPTVLYTQGLIKKFIGEWGFAGLKIDGQHLNNVAPCFNPAHHHARPEESVEGLQDFFRAIYQTAMQINPDAVIEVCPCGTAYSVFNFPYLNQAPASDPESSWQVRHKGKTLKALMGPSAPYAGDHVELSDGHDDFASTVGVGAVVSTKFTWPEDPKPKDSFLLTPEKERAWRRWIALYKEKMLPLGIYRGELYDIGFDRPETHIIEKDGRLYYAFFADRWSGPVALRGLQAGPYRIRDYFNERDIGTVSGAPARLAVKFERFLLLEAIPA
ncbi:MAG TPA: glycoside hydrolase family 36 protein [Steroidobacteraceae bacterium]